MGRGSSSVSVLAELLSSSSDSYSKRSASVGLTADARRAGISTAPTTPAARIQTAPAIVTGSVGLTSYSCDSTRRPSACPSRAGALVIKERL